MRYIKPKPTTGEGTNFLHTPLTHLAFAIAHMAHAGQKDKAGQPYIEHVIAVAEQMPDEISTAIALLHDVVKDNPEFTFKTLLLYGVPPEVVKNVEYLTPKEGQSYYDYIRSLYHKPLARAVKLADLEHDCDLARYEAIPIVALEYRERYLKAIDILRAPEQAQEESA